MRRNSSLCSLLRPGPYVFYQPPESLLDRQSQETQTRTELQTGAYRGAPVSSQESRALGTLRARFIRSRSRRTSVEPKFICNARLIELFKIILCCHYITLEKASSLETSQSTVEAVLTEFRLPPSSTAAAFPDDSDRCLSVLERFQAGLNFLDKSLERANGEWLCRCKDKFRTYNLKGRSIEICAFRIAE